MRGTTAVDGIISGFDTTAIINELMSARQAAVIQLQSRRADYASKLTAWEAVNASLLALKTLAANLTTDAGVYPKVVTSSDTSLLTASATSSAALMTADVVINKLAQAHKISSGTQADPAAALGLSGDIILNGQAISVTAQDSLADIRTKINDADAGVIASLITVSDSDYRLVLTSAETGADSAIELADVNTSDILESIGFLTSSISIKHAVANGAASDLFADSTSAVKDLLSLTSPPSGTVTINGIDVSIDLSADSLSDIADRITTQVSGVTATVVQESVDGTTYSKLQIVGDSGTPTFGDPDNILSTLGILQKQIADQLQAPQDAEIELDGITVTRSSNTISDIVNGVTINLLGADPSTTIHLQVADDIDAVQSSVENLIEQFNSVMDLFAEQLSYDPDTEESGVLFGDFTLVNLQARLRQSVTAPVLGLTGDYTLPAQLGISSDIEDHISLDSDQFRAAYDDDPSAVAALLKTAGTTTDPDITFVCAGHDTQPTGDTAYIVHIDSLATKASKTGNDISAGLAQDETLTIDGAYVVSLQAGWTTQQVVDAINNIMTSNGVEITAEADGGKVKLTHNYYGSQYSIEVSSTVASGTPGSTGLGAPIANETATYTGTDVQGTINGEPATGNGQMLTGDEGNDNTAGLVLRVGGSSTGDRGTVTVTKGLAARLDDLLHFITKTNGLIDVRSQSIQDEIDYFDERIAELQERLSQEEERLYEKFSAMESALGSLQRQSSWLAAQFATLFTFNWAPTRTNR